VVEAIGAGEAAQWQLSNLGHQYASPPRVKSWLDVLGRGSQCPIE
jgi:hypothetical protein